jgi:hypothetical protein
VSCAICKKRKEKRFCPAIHGRICPQCCGEQREVTLDCPSGCVYLQQAREHEKQRSIGDMNPADLFVQVEVEDQFLYQHEHLLMGLTFALSKSVRADRSLNDPDLIAALTALTKTWETLVNSGLHYENPIASPAQHAVVAEVQDMVKEYREAEQKRFGSAARPGFPGTHGPRPYLRKAEIPSIRRLSAGPISGKALRDCRAGRRGQPTHYAVTSTSDVGRRAS